MTAFKPTDEQIQAMDLAQKLQSLKINAFAGSGKTSTLELIGGVMPSKRGLYLSFNKMITESAKARMPPQIEVRTFHSLAFRETGKDFANAGRLEKRLNGSSVATALNLNSFLISRDNRLSPAFLGGLVLSAVERFCTSLEENIETWHFPHTGIEGLEKNTEQQLRESLLPMARRLWEMMSDKNSSFPSSHNVYVKLWANTQPKIRGYDYIMFDEAQDADVLMLDIVERQSQPVIWVGDRYQSIYGWRGAVNAIEKIQTANTCVLTLSFRFGQEIADHANQVLTILGESTKIKGNPAVKSVLAKTKKPDAILCRTNAVVVDELFSNVNGKKTIAATGTSEAKAFFWNAKNLKSGKGGTGALALFKTWDEVVDYSETESGCDLANYIKLTDQYGADAVLDLLDRVLDATKPENLKKADLAISTAHRAKGMEWSSVRLASDFKIPVPEAKKAPTAEEVRLLYVAMTRAQNTLDMSDLPQLFVDKGMIAKYCANDDKATQVSNGK